MRILVAGAGAVGSWLGGNLAAGGAEVVLVARGEHGQALAASGVRLGDGQTTIVRPPVFPTVAAASAAGPFDVALVAVKSYDTAALARELAAAGSPPRVACFQNGVGNESILAAELTTSAIVPATLTTGVHISAPGVVTAWHKGGVGLSAPADGPDVSDLAAAFRAGGLSVRLYPDGAGMKWSKLLLNLLGSASSAVLAWPPPRVLADRRIFDIEHGAWLEALAAMRAGGRRPVALPGYRVGLLATLSRWLPPVALHAFVHRKVAAERGDRLPSVAADLARGRPRSEIEVLNGAVAAAGEAEGVAVPVNRALTRLVSALAAGRLDRAEFAGQPAALQEWVTGSLER